jgi:hypothetical protein
VLAKFFKRYIILFVSVLSVSCASNPIKLTTVERVPNNLISIVDNRPVSERKTRSPKIGGTSYYPGDDKFQPNIVESLQIALTKKLDSSTPPPKISIEHSQVLNFFGKHDNQKNRAIGATFLTGGLIKGWLEEERFKNANFVSCEILGKVNDIKFEATYAEPYEVKSSAYLVVYNGPDANKATAKVVKECIKITAGKIAAKIAER